MAVGFGLDAVRYAARVPAELSMIAADLRGAMRGLEAAIQHRRAGRLFYAAPLVDDPRALLARQLAGRWMQRLTSIDQRYQAFDALASDRLADVGFDLRDDDLAVIDEPARRVLRDFAITGDALLVRSMRDVERISRVLGRKRPIFFVASGIDPNVPTNVHPHGDAVVVWAPQLNAEDLGVIAMALEYMRCNVIYVCAAGKLANVRGDFVRGTDGAAVLSTAACVIDAAISDPASAIALANCGIPIVAAATAGASEYLDGILEYDPWDWRSVFSAVSAARGARRPVTKRDPLCLAELERTLARTEAPQLSVEPLVSVVVVTYNRRELLPLTLDSIAGQRYRNIEIIVVANGGVDVCDIVARYSQARLIQLAENLPLITALDIGIKSCRGKYFCVVSDDDEYYPDHFAQLVGSLEQADAEVGHTNAVTRYVTTASGVREVVAYRVRHDRPSDRLQILVGGTMVIHGTLFRHDVREIIGEFRPDIAPADYEYVLRASQRFDFVFVDVVTCEWNYIVEGVSYTHGDAMYEGLKKVYAEYPSDGSSIVEERRAREMLRFEGRSDGKPLWPPDLLLQ